MLETVREYAAEALDRSGDADTFKQRHAEWVLERIEASANAYMGGSDAEGAYLALLDEEHDNVRVALEWADGTADVERLRRLACAARWFWVLRGYLSEGRRFFDALIEKTVEAPREVRAQVVGDGGVFPFRQGDTARAKALWREAVRLYEELGDENEVGRCYSELGAVAMSEGELDEATTLLERGAGIFRAIDNKSRLGVALSNLGAIANLREDPVTAVQYFEEAIALGRETGDRDGLAISLHNASRSLMALGKLDDARDALTESLTIGRELGYQELVAYCFGGFAELAMHNDAPEEAATLLGAAERLFGDVGAAIDPDETQTQQKVLAYAVERLGAERAKDLRAAGAARPVEDLLAA
jgi:tetratricopeptide (TPR) repeat protein